MLDSRKSCLRFGESLLANWICDVCAEDYSADEGHQAADFAMLMGLAMTGNREDPSGSVTVGHLFAWVPKVVVLVVLKLKGADVIRSLERGCGSLPGECATLHHVSKRLSYQIDTSKAKGEGRVHDVLLDGKPLDTERVYSVATTAAMAVGKYGYDWMAAAERVVDEEFGTPIVDLVRAWFKKHPTGEQAINPSAGRIKI